MATVNLSDYDKDSVPSGDGMKIGIVVSDWNSEVTFKLLEGAYNTLLEHGVAEENIVVCHVPGSFELIQGSQSLAGSSHNVDAVIALGCVVRGGTPHFDYVCQGTTYGIAKLNTEWDLPFIFGLLTTDDMQQSLDRAGGKLGNKGVEAAVTALKMVDLCNKLESVGID